MRCLVLGGCGFIGSHLVDALLAAGHYVKCFDRPNVRPVWPLYRDNSNFAFYEGDFTSEFDITRALNGCDICFHLASTTLPKSSNDDPVLDVENNILANVRMLTYIQRSGLKKIIFASSGGTVYGTPREIPIPETHPTDPTCSYGITKLTIEKYLELFHQLHGLEYAVLRLANPYGERQRTAGTQGAIAVFLRRALLNEPIDIWGDGSIVRDYIHVDDVVCAFLRVMGDTANERIFNIGSGKGVALLEVLEIIEATLGYKTVRLHRAARTFDVPVNVLCTKRAHTALNWQPRIEFASGIARFAKWMMSERGNL
jgi:UDP-glucose 4-epimerase